MENSEVEASSGGAAEVRALFEAAPMPMATLSGPERVMEAANAAYRAMIGREAVIGRRSDELVPEVMGQQLLEFIDRAREASEPTVVKGWRLYLDLEGTGAMTEIFVDMTAIPYRDADGRPAGAHFYLRDVTQEVTARRVAESRAASAQRELLAAREVITTLQEAHLPAGLPVLRDYEIAGSYLLAQADITAGGDWLDAVPTGPHRTAFVVGDVVGHGVHASAAMGQLRSVVISALLDDDDPARALTKVERFAHTVPEARFATVCIAVLDHATGAVEYCTAGHPPPLHCSRGGTQFLPPTGAGPLGSSIGHPTSRVVLQPGDALVLYTDGLVERPSRTLDQSTTEIVEVVADAYLGRGPNASGHDTGQRITETAVEQLVRAGGHSDDVTVLCLTRREQSAPAFDTVVTAYPDAVRTLRTDLTDWCEDLRLSDVDRIIVPQVVEELADNVVRHAYPEGVDAATSTIAVTASLAEHGSGEIHIRVADRGTWRSPEPGNGPHGLAILEGLTESLHIEHGTDGTTVTAVVGAQRPLSTHPSAPLTSASPVAIEERLRLDVEDAHDDGPVTITATGAVDATAALRLRHALVKHLAAGSRKVVLDLSGTTLLISSGVRALWQLQGPTLQLQTTVGTASQHILDLVGLDWTPAPTPTL